MTDSVWENNVLVQTHDAYNNGHLPTSLHVLGTEGALVAHDCNTQLPVGDVTLWRDNVAEPLDVGARDDLYQVTVRAFGAAVRGEGEVLISGEAGVRSLAFSLAVLQSLRSGARTRVQPDGP